MASEKTFIRRSKVLTHSLGGQAGLLRESGLNDNKVGMSNAWSQGLDNRVLWRRKETALPMEFTNLIYDETLQATIFGLKAKDELARRAPSCIGQRICQGF